MPDKDLSEAQITAIKHASGPIQVLAGPGSGKTYLTIRRIRHLIQHHGISPNKILVITFTKAAATEMKERFYQLTKGAYQEVNFGTFHSVFFHILRQSGKQNLSLASAAERYKYLKHILYSLNIEEVDNPELLSNLLKSISSVKNKLEHLEDNISAICQNIVVDGADEEILDNFPAIYEEYQRIMKEQNRIDFDDMIILCAKLLKENERARKFWQNAFSHILVDEFQDISPLQYQILKYLALPDNNIFVVGDDDQSIYGFRGAGPEIMKHFTRDYPDTCQITLEINYRSGTSIVAAADTVISDNKNRYEKKIEACNNSGYVEVKSFLSKEEEYEYMTNELLQKPIEDLSQCAIIYRTNAEAAFCSRMLTTHRIPYHLHDKVDNLFEHYISKDILAYLNFANDTFSNYEKTGKRSDFLRFMNKPLRYIKRDAVSSSAIVTEKLLYDYYREQYYMLKYISKVFVDLKRISALRPYLAIDYIRHKIGYEAYLCTDKKKDEQMIIKDTLDEIQKTAVDYHTLAEWKQYVEEYSETLAKENNRQAESSKGVQLLTMHASKGLEYEKVYLPDIKRGSMPNKKAVTPEALEEERRLLYVAMTRAKKRLEILYYGEASPFITKLNKVT